MTTGTGLVRLTALRCERIILDRELAAIYGVSTGRLNEAVKRNLERFPADFMFQLTAQELENLRSQIATSNARLATDLGASDGK